MFPKQFFTKNLILQIFGGSLGIADPHRKSLSISRGLERVSVGHGFANMHMCCTHLNGISYADGFRY